MSGLMKLSHLRRLCLVSRQRILTPARTSPCWLTWPCPSLENNHDAQVYGQEGDQDTRTRPVQPSAPGGCNREGRYIPRRNCSLSFEAYSGEQVNSICDPRDEILSGT